jgi:hypothetical protein
MKKCDGLPTTVMLGDGGEIVASFWRPSPEELKTLTEGGSVVLYVWGMMHPPVSIGVVTKE